MGNCFPNIYQWSVIEGNIYLLYAYTYAHNYVCDSEQRSLLEKCAATALSSKLIAQQKEFFSKMVVDAVLLLDELLPLSMIGMKKVKGGSLEVKEQCRRSVVMLYKMQDSRLIGGVAFKKTFSYAGFEMQPKKYSNPKIALLNVELELKAEKTNAEIRIDNVEVITSNSDDGYLCVGITRRIISLLLMLSGPSYTTSWRRFTRVGQRLYCQSCPLGMWPPSILLTGERTCVYVHTCTHTHACTHIHTHTHTHTHKHTHTHTHTHTCMYARTHTLTYLH